MTEYEQKTIALNNFEMGDVINYLHENYGFASVGRFDLKESGKIEIPSLGREIICNCDEKIINNLQDLIEQNE